jgi:PAS domain S-box-containing protein
MIAWTHTVVTDDRGGPAYVVATGRDVTEERRSQEALRRTEERLEGILLSIDDFVWSQNAVTREMLYVSPSVERIYGIKPEAMRANTRIWMEVIHPDDRERVASYLPSLLSAGRATAEYRIVRDDGSIRWVHDRAWAIRDFEGRMIRFDGIVRDITDQKHLESQFRQSQKMEAVGLLAGGIAHDFNNLLTAIGGYAELLLNRLHPGDPSREQAEAVKRAAARAASLTRQLLAFSRRQVLQPRVVDLNELVGGMEPLVQRLVGEDVEVVLRRSPALGAVRVDAGQMEQVLMNLVVNARDAMPEGGRMTIRTENLELDAPEDDDARLPAGPYVALGVSDTGSGMDEAVRARIFEPFFTTKPVGKGTGLGLSTVYGIVEQSGGHIEVETAEGSGTTFRVLLPRHLGASIPDGPELVPQPEAPCSSTLLLVEDEPSVRELACEILESEGYDVLCATDGREALETARRHADRIRLVITDVVMPRMGGLELVEALGDVLPGAPVVFMSGYSESVVRGEARFSAGAGFLQKPFTPADLLRHAREALDRAGRSRV